MSYATIDEVKTMFRDFADNSEAAVTDTEITLFLDNTTSIIDAAIGEYYLLPITEGSTPESFNILKQLQMYKVAGIIDDILNDYSEADKKPMWSKKAEMLLKNILPHRDKKTCRECDPVLKLPDAPFLGTKTGRNKIKISNTSGTVFKKNEDNW